MGTLALRRIGSRLISPTAVIWAAGLLVFIVTCPSGAEARFSGQQVHLARQCATLTPTERAEQDSDPCLTRHDVPSGVPFPEPSPVGGKIEAALADLLCRLLFSDHWELSRNSDSAVLNASQQQIIEPAPVHHPKVPGGGFGPALGPAKIEYLAVARLPDG